MRGYDALENMLPGRRSSKLPERILNINTVDAPGQLQVMNWTLLDKHMSLKDAVTLFFCPGTAAIRTTKGLIVYKNRHRVEAVHSAVEEVLQRPMQESKSFG